MTDKTKLTEVQKWIVKEIRRLYRRDEPLNITAVRRKHPELLDAVYKIKPFWGWKGALEAAGIGYKNIRVELLDYVVCRICGKELGILASHLCRKHGVLSEDYKIDYPDAELQCDKVRIMKRRRNNSCGGSMSRFPDWESVWSREYVLDKVWEYWVRGYPINMAAFENTLKEKSLTKVCLKYFSSWDTMLLALGLEPRKIRLWEALPYRSRKDVVRAIQDRKNRGLPINISVLKKNKFVGNPALASSAKKFFGTYEKAVEAAGISYKIIALSRRYPRIIGYNRRYPTSDAVLKEIARRHKLKLELSCDFTQKHDRALYNTAVLKFGAWRAAITAAGLDYDRICKRKKNELSMKKYPDKVATIQAIREREKAGLPLVFKALDRDLFLAVRRFFRTWIKVIHAAGVLRTYRTQCYEQSRKAGMMNFAARNSAQKHR